MKTATRTPLRMMSICGTMVATLLILNVGVYAIAPLESLYDIGPPILLNSLFWGLFFLAAFIVSNAIKRGWSSKNPVNLIQPMINAGIIEKLLVTSIAGLLLHCYSKYALTHIHPVNCIFDIRFAWLEVDHALQPTHIRIASVLGHLLTSLAFPGLVLSVSGFVGTTDLRASKLRLFTFATSFFLIAITYSAFIGSRNALLSFLVLATFGAVIGLCQQPLAKRTVSRALVVLTFGAFLGLTFAGAVFLDRMFCGAVSGQTDQTAQVTTGYLKGFEDEIPVRIAVGSNGVVDPFWVLCPPCAPTILYLSHGLLNSAQVMSTEARGRRISTSTLFWITSRLGFPINLSETSYENKVYGQGGLPFAGSIYHDFGWVGVIVISVFLGGLFGVALRGLQAPSFVSGISMVFVVCCFYSMALAFVFTGPTLMPFPFIVFSMTVVFVGLPLFERTLRSAARS